MAITLGNLDLGVVDSGVILADQTKASAFQSLGKNIFLPLEGASVSTLSGIEAYGVGEGKAKTASGTNAAIKVGANKSASVVVFTEEELTRNERIAEVVYNLQPNAHARLFDNVVAGIVNIPANWANFGTLTAAEEVALGTGSEAGVDFDEAIGEVENGDVNGVILTTKLLSYLRSQREDVSGARVFDITDSTINGLPYKTIVSATAVGYVGDFANSFVWGIRPFDTPYRIKDAGTITDSDSVVHNLTAENKTALFNEQFVGAGVANIANFAKLTIAGEDS